MQSAFHTLEQQRLDLLAQIALMQNDGDNSLSQPLSQQLHAYLAVEWESLEANRGSGSNLLSQKLVYARKLHDDLLNAVSAPSECCDGVASRLSELLREIQSYDRHVIQPVSRTRNIDKTVYGEHSFSYSYANA